MTAYIPDRVEAARAGRHPALISKLPSGWVVLCDTQFLPGYCIQLPDPVVPSINHLDRIQRVQFLCDMILVGDALLEVTDAYRINYAIAGNSDPYLHAHIVPRYMSEPEVFRKDLPWSHPQSEKESMLFDIKRHKRLMERLRQSIEKRL